MDEVVLVVVDGGCGNVCARSEVVGQVEVEEAVVVVRYFQFAFGVAPHPIAGCSSRLPPGCRLRAKGPYPGRMRLRSPYGMSKWKMMGHR